MSDPTLRQYPAIYSWPDETLSTREEFLVAHKNADFITVSTLSNEIRAEYVYVRYNQPSGENVERAQKALYGVDFETKNDRQQALTNVARALQAVANAAERRGVVRWLRSKAEEFGMENITSATSKRIIEGWANELESATKADSQFVNNECATTKETGEG